MKTTDKRIQSICKDQPMEQLTKLGAKIREARQRQNLTLRDIADQVGLTVSHISQMERGLTNPSVSALLSIAGALGLPMEYFFSSEALTLATRESADATGPSWDASTSLRRTHGAPRARLDVAESRELPSPGVSPIVKNTLRDIIKVTGGIEWQRLTPHHDNTIEFIELRYDVGASGGDSAYMHHGREYGVILEGRLQVELGFSKHVLEPGDSISFDCSIPHRFVNIGVVPVRGIWVIVDRY